MTSQSECVLKLYGLLSVFRRILWLYISPLTARAIVSSSLVIGCAPESGRVSRLRIDDKMRYGLTDTDDTQTLMHKDYKWLANHSILDVKTWSVLVLCDTTLPPKDLSHYAYYSSADPSPLTPVRSSMSNTMNCQLCLSVEHRLGTYALPSFKARGLNFCTSG
jgi:hypothetical protein